MKLSETPGAVDRAAPLLGQNTEQILIELGTGAYSLNNKVWDVGVMLVFGVLGYAMKKLDYSPAALTLALVLGPLAERALRQSLIISDAGIAIFLMRPISAVLTLLALSAVAVPAARALWQALRGRRPGGGGLTPPATKGLDAGGHVEIHGLRQGQLVGEQRPLGVDDDEVVNQAIVVLRLREPKVVLGFVDCRAQGSDLVGEGGQVGQGVLHVSIGDESLVHVRGDGLPVAGLRRVEIGRQSAALKDRNGDARGDGRDAALPVEERGEVGAPPVCSSCSAAALFLARLAPLL